MSGKVVNLIREMAKRQAEYVARARREAQLRNDAFALACDRDGTSAKLGRFIERRGNVFHYYPEGH